MSAGIKFGKVTFYNPATQKGIIEIEDSEGGEAKQPFDASRYESLKTRLTAIVGHVPSWEAVELLEKKPVDVFIQTVPGDEETQPKIEVLE